MKHKFIVFTMITVFLCTLGGCQAKPEEPAPCISISAEQTGFAACGENGWLAKISTEGEKTEIQTATSKKLNAVCTQKNNILAVGEAGTLVFCEDGKVIKSVSLDEKSGFYAVGYFRGKWIIGGEEYILSGESADSLEKVKITDEKIVSIAASEEMCIAAAENGMLYLSEDGDRWEELDFNTYYQYDMTFQQIVYGGGNFYLLGEEDGRQKIMISSMGSVWSERVIDMLEGKPADLSQEEYVGIVWDGEELIAACKSGGLLTLPDCTSCNKLEETELDSLSAIAYSGGYFLLEDEQGNIITQDSEKNRQYKVSPETVYEKRKDLAYLIDVRSEEEYEEGHIAGSIHIETEQIGQLESICPDKNSEIIFYCSKGVRSHKAMEEARKMGYQNVFYMGDLENWPESLEQGNNE